MPIHEDNQFNYGGMNMQNMGANPPVGAGVPQFGMDMGMMGGMMQMSAQEMQADMVSNVDPNLWPFYQNLIAAKPTAEVWMWFRGQSWEAIASLVEVKLPDVKKLAKMGIPGRRAYLNKCMQLRNYELAYKQRILNRAEDHGNIQARAANERLDKHYDNSADTAMRGGGLDFDTPELFGLNLDRTDPGRAPMPAQPRQEPQANVQEDQQAAPAPATKKSRNPFKRFFRAVKRKFS